MKNDFSLPSQTGEGIDSLVTLYSGPEDHYSHRIRFALNLKGIEFSLEEEAKFHFQHSYMFIIPIIFMKMYRHEE